MRLMIANLDCESDFAVDAGAPPAQLPRPVLQRISAYGTLLGVFGRAGDVLWTPLPVDAARVAGAARGCVLVSGALAALPRPDAMLAWGETRAVAALRSGMPEFDESVGAYTRDDSYEHDAWPERLWALHPDPDAARRCNDRRFCLALGQALGLRLPGAALLGSVDELVAHLAAGGGDAGHEQSWVLKAPFSASGRLRLRRRGRVLDQASRVRAQRLFARFGALCFEPWMERVLDFGCLGLVEGPGRWHVLAPHWLESDDAGVFRGIVVGPAAGAGWLDAGEQRTVMDTAAAAARALGDAGYRGPFGIDGFVYRAPEAGGARRLIPMCEINARASFGFVAHALARVHGAASLRLRLGAGPVPAGAGIMPLLHAGAPDDASAWIEVL